MSDYWKSRSHYAYYATVRRLLESLSPAESLLDVGSADTPIACWGRFKRRVAVDLATLPDLKGVKCIQGDWLELAPSRYSVICCCQVLEHLNDGTIGRFARKILDEGELAIISIPHFWPAGSCQSHVQDPCGREDLVAWFAREPIWSEIVRDGNRERLIALFLGNR